MPLTLTTTAFIDTHEIPVKFTRDGANLSPALSWSGAPAGTKGFALILADPDAPNGTFYHWAAFDIPADRGGVAEGFGGKTPEHAATGINDFGNKRYDGPQPPLRHGIHHYHFRLAALDVPSLKLPDRVTVAEVWRAAQHHALATAEIVGTYER